MTFASREVIRDNRRPGETGPLFFRIYSTAASPEETLDTLIAYPVDLNPDERKPLDSEENPAEEEDGQDRKEPSGVSDERNVERGQFPVTRWTLVCQAQDATEISAHHALSTLCEMYWYPLYAFARRSGSSKADAEDLTQGYFAQLLEKGYLDHVAQEKGKLRTFLLTSFRNYMSKRRAHDRAQKRGGGQVHLSIDQAAAEERYSHDLVDTLTPEDVYERHFVLMVLEHSMNALQAEFEAQNKAALFRALKGSLLPHDSARPYAEIAEVLGTTVGAIKMTARRMRERYRELLQDQIAHTVQSPEEVKGEIVHLFAVFGKR